MAFSGTTHNRIHDFTDDEASSIDPSAQRFDEEFDDISSSMETRLAKDGTNTATADIPMGGFTLTGLAAGATAGEALRYEQLPSTATDSAEGIVELATTAEIDTGTDTGRVITPAGLTHVLDGSSTANPVTDLALGPNQGTPAAGNVGIASGSGIVLNVTDSTPQVAIEFTVNIAGTYRVRAQFYCLESSGTIEELTCRIANGGTSLQTDFIVVSGSIQGAVEITADAAFIAGDVIKISVYESAGAASTNTTLCFASVCCDSVGFIVDRVGAGAGYVA